MEVYHKLLLNTSLMLNRPSANSATTLDQLLDLGTSKNELDAPKIMNMKI